MALIPKGYKGSVDQIAWAKHMSNAGPMGVATSGDWLVTKTVGVQRGFTVAAGTGWGDGVIDTEAAPTDLVCDVNGSASVRYDVIVCRRTWLPTLGASTSQFVIVKGTAGAGRVLPSGGSGIKRLPGDVADQLLAIVPVFNAPVSDGEQAPSDLRVGVHGIVVAPEVLALPTDVPPNVVGQVGHALYYFNGSTWQPYPRVATTLSLVSSGWVNHTSRPLNIAVSREGVAHMQGMIRRTGATIALSDFEAVLIGSITAKDTVMPGNAWSTFDGDVHAVCMGERGWLDLFIEHAVVGTTGNVYLKKRPGGTTQIKGPSTSGGTDGDWVSFHSTTWRVR